MQRTLKWLAHRKGLINVGDSDSNGPGRTSPLGVSDSRLPWLYKPEWAPLLCRPALGTSCTCLPPADPGCPACWYLRPWQLPVPPLGPRNPSPPPHFFPCETCFLLSDCEAHGTSIYLVSLCKTAKRVDGKVIKVVEIYRAKFIFG